MINAYGSFIKNCCDWGLEKNINNANHMVHNTIQAISDAFTNMLDEQMQLVQRSIKNHTDHVMNKEQGIEPSIQYTMKAFKDLDETINNMSKLRSDLMKDLGNIYNTHVSKSAESGHADVRDKNSCN